LCASECGCPSDGAFEFSVAIVMIDVGELLPIEAEGCVVDAVDEVGDSAGLSSGSVKESENPALLPSKLEQCDVWICGIYGL
jgi:hypothetical protein